VFLGANALFKRLETANAVRYAGQVGRLLPDCRFTILGYTGSSFEEIVADMADCMERPADLLLGISFGGFIAARMAAQHPELVRRLVLLVSAHRFSENGRGMMERQFEALERGDFEALLRDNALQFRRPWYNWLVGLKQWKDRDRMAGQFRPAAEILHDYLQLFGPEFEKQGEYAGRIASPTLVVGGTADCYFDRAAFEATAALIPGAELRLIDGETHMLPIERSAAVARAIREFAR